MSKIKLALDVVSDLMSLAESIEMLARAMEANETNEENEVAKEPVKEAKKKAKTIQVSEPANDEQEVEAVSEEKQPTLEEVRAAMADKSRDGHREAVKAILTKYGANNLSALDPKYYADALKESGELK
jgi:hypothetical protein